MGSRSEIRRAAPGDLDALCGIELGCFGTAADAFSRRQLAYLISKARGASFVAECGGRVVGYLSLLARARYADVRIYSIAVAPDARGCGAGQRLVEQAVAYARTCGARTLTLEVSVSNDAALALYRKHGFEIISRIPQYYHDGGDAWRMQRGV